MSDLCLANGFTLEQPSGNVISSREIKEVHAGEILTTGKKLTQQTTYDSLGLPHTLNTYSDEQVNKKVRAWCIGSEYIVAT